MVCTFSPIVSCFGKKAVLVQHVLERGQVGMLLPIYMVACSKWRPSLRAGEVRIDPRALKPSVVAMTDAKQTAVGSAFPLFPGERPPIKDVLAWLRVATPTLSADQTSLNNGYEPVSLMGFSPETVPVNLVAASGGITETAVESRVALRMQIQDRNDLKQQQHRAQRANILHAWFKSIDVAVRPNAPLLIEKMENECKQPSPFDKYFDGKAAWDIIVQMSLVGAMIPGESASHDAALIALQLKPLQDGSTPDEYSLRVVGALTNHIPYLERPFPTRERISWWAVQQAPDVHSSEARQMYERLTASEKDNPHGVASRVVELMAKARKPSDILKESALSEFVGIATDGGGRRPRDMA